MADPPKKFWRLAPGREVRLRYGYLITCNEVVKDDDGEITEIICTIDPETRGGSAPDGRPVKGTLHWVSASHALDVEVRLYDRLFKSENPAMADDFLQELNPDSLTIVTNARLESGAKDLVVGETVQFERLGYFTVDIESTADHLMFNRTVTLRDNWASKK